MYLHRSEKIFLDCNQLIGGPWVVISSINPTHGPSCQVDPETSRPQLGTHYTVLVLAVALRVEGRRRCGNTSPFLGLPNDTSSRVTGPFLPI